MLNRNYHVFQIVGVGGLAKRRYGVFFLALEPRFFIQGRGTYFLETCLMGR